MDNICEECNKSLSICSCFEYFTVNLKIKSVDGKITQERLEDSEEYSCNDST